LLPGPRAAAALGDRAMQKWRALETLICSEERLAIAIDGFL
jgi:hypothetical protein